MILALLASLIFYQGSSAEIRLTNSSPHVATLRIFNGDDAAVVSDTLTVEIDGIEITFTVHITSNPEGDTVTVQSLTPGYYARPESLYIEERDTGEIEIYEWVIGDLTQ